jgi:5-methylcytosine-specific restriction endonuclease McrA
MPVTLICQYAPCHKPFDVKPYQARDGSAKYCSYACKGLAQRVERTEEEQRALQAAYQAKALAKKTEEERRAYWRAEYHRNRDKRLQSMTRYREENREFVRGLQRTSKKAWNAANKDLVHAKNQKYYEENTAKICAHTATYQRENPEKVKVFQSRRRARKAAGRNDLAPQQWEEVLQAFDSRCAYCHKKSRTLEMEHVVPLSKGGENTVSNIVPSCVRCNRKKSAGPVPTPVQTLLFTIASAKPLQSRKKKA